MKEWIFLFYTVVCGKVRILNKGFYDVIACATIKHSQRWHRSGFGKVTLPSHQYNYRKTFTFGLSHMSKLYIKTQMHIYIPIKYKEQANDFFKRYDFSNVVYTSNKTRTKFRQKTDRICRFCNKKYPEVTFKSIAHTIPELLGNKHHFSDFECDNCNQVFGKYENDLSNFLSITRTITGVKSKNKIPKFKSANKTVTAENECIDHINEKISVSAHDGNYFNVDPQTGNVEINYMNNSYVPLNVYKSFLKMALSIMPENEILQYQIAIGYLTSNELNNSLKGFSQIVCYTLPLSMCMENPIGFLFKKKSHTEKLITHVFVLYYQCFIFELIVPCNIFDLKGYWNQHVLTYWCPPFYSDEKNSKMAERVEIYTTTYDLSSSELVKGEIGKMNIKLATINSKNVCFVDNNTGNQITDNIDYSKIVRIQIDKFIP